MVRKLFDDAEGEELITVDESYLPPERFAGLSEARFLEGFRPTTRSTSSTTASSASSSSGRSAACALSACAPRPARRLEMPARLEVLRTDRISVRHHEQPVEYRINRGRVERTMVSFDVVI